MNLYISNLSYNISDEDLRLLFADYGEITSAKVIMDRETGRSRGFGFVELSDDELAKKAIEELNQASYDGKVINITEARPREDRGDRGGRFNNNRGGGYGSNRGGGYGSNRGGGYGSNRDGGRYSFYLDKKERAIRDGRSFLFQAHRLVHGLS